MQSLNLVSLVFQKIDSLTISAVVNDKTDQQFFCSDENILCFGHFHCVSILKSLENLLGYF